LCPSLAGVLQEHARLVEPAHRHVQLDRLGPGHSLVVVTMLDQQRRVDPFGEEQR
jgi:hypothetical protein